MQTASTVQGGINFQFRIVSADNTSGCQWVNGDFGMSPFHGQLGQAVPTFIWMCGAEAKAQGSVNYLVCGQVADGESLSRLKIRLLLYSAIIHCDVSFGPKIRHRAYRSLRRRGSTGVLFKRVAARKPLRHWRVGRRKWVLCVEKSLLSRAREPELAVPLP